MTSTACSAITPLPRCTDHRVMTALRRGIPLTLLCDLFEPPSSSALLMNEREDPWLERLAYEATAPVEHRGVRSA